MRIYGQNNCFNEKNDKYANIIENVTKSMELLNNLNKILFFVTKGNVELLQSQQRILQYYDEYNFFLKYHELI